jgi:hypothetical protein
LFFLNIAGLSELTFDLRPEIRKSALQVLFDTLRNHGHLFSLPLWEKVFDSVLFPIFDYVRHAIDPSGSSPQGQSVENDPAELDQDAWLYETCTLALQLVVDLFVRFYSTVNPLLKKVLSLLTSFIKRPHQSLAGIGIAAFVRLMSSAGSMFVDEKWLPRRFLTSLIFRLELTCKMYQQKMEALLNREKTNLNHWRMTTKNPLDQGTYILQLAMPSVELLCNSF